MPNNVLEILHILNTVFLSGATHTLFIYYLNLDYKKKKKKKLIRITTNCNYFAHTQHLFKGIHALKLFDLSKLHIATHM